MIGKRPFVEGWQQRRMNPFAERDRFAGATGVGVVLGLSGLVDLEADCLAAELALEALAPPTGCIWQHGGRRHRLYRADAAHQAWIFQGSTLVELRAGEHQSVAPPSIHPETAQPYTWVAEGEPSAASASVLERAATLAAVASACARCWPKAPSAQREARSAFGAARGAKWRAPSASGASTEPSGASSRHYAALALAGTLRRAGVTGEEARAVVRAICAAEPAEVEAACSERPGSRCRACRRLLYPMAPPEGQTLPRSRWRRRHPARARRCHDRCRLTQDLP